jgi:arsenate reductase
MSEISSEAPEPISSELEAIVQRLADRHHGVLSEETIAACVEESWRRLAARAPVTAPLTPALVQRFAEEQLDAEAQAQGLVAKELAEVLFVCVHNAGRSQMAAALAHQLGANRIRVRSAGSAPREEILPEVIEAMNEVGLDVAQEFPKPLTDVVVRAADVVITMGCGDACPIYPGKRYEDWEVPNPAGQPIETVREIRDEIRSRVLHLLDTLPEPAAGGRTEGPR